MYNIKILEEGYAAVIELADGSFPDDDVTLSCMLHLIKLVRSAVNDFPQNAEQLEKMKSLLDIYAAKLKKRTGKKVIQFAIDETVSDSSVKKNKYHLPLTNAHCALAYFIRQKVENGETDNFPRLYKIADLYMHRLFKYSEEIKSAPDIKNSQVIGVILYMFTIDMGHHVGYLESAMKNNGIKFDEIMI